MKQVKFFLVALMAAVSVLFTSCLNGDENTVREQVPAIVKCIGTYPPTFQTSYGQKLVVNDASLISLNLGEIYFFYYRYDSAEQPDNSPTLNVQLYGGSTPVSVSAKYSEGPMMGTESNKANAPLYAFNTDNMLRPEAVAFGEGELYINIPVIYWVKAENNEVKTEELNKHSFILTYDEIKTGDTELVMTLNHVINDGAEESVERKDKTASYYKLYNLTNLKNAFQSTSGQKLAKITIKAKVNTSKNSLEDARDASSWEYTIKQ